MSDERELTCAFVWAGEHFLTGYPELAMQVLVPVGLPGTEARGRVRCLVALGAVLTGVYAGPSGAELVRPAAVVAERLMAAGSRLDDAAIQKVIAAHSAQSDLWVDVLVELVARYALATAGRPPVEQLRPSTIAPGGRPGSADARCER